MNDYLDHATAEVYARWFRSLADPQRVRILNLLAVGGREMTVGAIVEAIGLGQSSVSHHLRVLHEVGFVTRRRAGTSAYYSVNQNCLSRFPTAAEMVMGRLPRYPAPHAPTPWTEEPAAAGQ